MNSWRRLPFILAIPVLGALARGPLGVAGAATPAKAQHRATASGTTAACLGRALGGLENIARISTLYTRYQFEAGGLKGTDVFWRDVRGAVRESLEVPGAFSDVVVFDGVRGWRRGSNGAVLPLSGADLADRVTDAYLGIYMHIVPGRILGKVERMGVDRASGLVKLRVQPQGGTPVTLMLDTLTCLPARIVYAAGDGTETIHMHDWRVVSGIKLPFAMRRSAGDSTADVKLTLLEARFDADRKSAKSDFNCDGSSLVSVTRSWVCPTAAGTTRTDKMSMLPGAGAWNWSPTRRHGPVRWPPQT